jgi:tRNA (cmo5U34)-methyltransferase
VGDFERSNWADEQFSTNYLDKADVFIPDRRRMFALVQSLIRHRFPYGGPLRILDLGAGDGALGDAVLGAFPTSHLTLVDASEAMLAEARQRFAHAPDFRFVLSDFQALMAGDELAGPFEACVSSQAIHHLGTEDKNRLFVYIHRLLAPGGVFVNADALLPPTEDLEKFYLGVWAEQMADAAGSLGMDEFVPEDVIRSYQDPRSMNRPDTIERQLAFLRKAGFVNVDCYFRSGIFAVFGGMRAGSGGTGFNTDIR